MSIESMMLSNDFVLCSSLLFLASKSFSMSWLLISGGQSISASASVSVLPMNIQGWFLLGLTGLISLRAKELKSLLQHHNMKSPILLLSIFFMIQLSHLYMTTGKATALTTWTFVGKVTSLLFNTLSRFVIAFLPRSKSVLISWLQSLSTVEIVSLFPSVSVVYADEHFPWTFRVSISLPIKWSNKT